jgi:ABC-type transport system substrate-binding protein
VASAGSYKLKRYDPVIGFVGERFKEHFAGWGDEAFDEIEFRAVLETNTRVQGLIKGHWSPPPSPSGLQQLVQRLAKEAEISAGRLLQGGQRAAERNVNKVPNESP